MPYYLFKTSTPDGIKLVKNLELVEVFDVFRDATRQARQLRSKNPPGDFEYKIMFAENQLSAEEQLQQKRAKPVLMEFER